MDHNIQFFLEIEINPFTKSEKPAKCTTDLYIPNKFYIRKNLKETAKVRFGFDSVFFVTEFLVVIKWQLTVLAVRASPLCSLCRLNLSSQTSF